MHHFRPMKRPAQNHTRRGLGITDIICLVFVVGLVVMMGVTAINFLISMTANKFGNDDSEKEAVAVVPVPDAEKGTETEISSSDPKETEATPEPAVVAELGTKKAYATCAACHGPEGKSPAGLAPPFVGSELATGSAERATLLVLKGIAPSGQYPGMMTPWQAILDDTTIADALSYIRTHFGNNASGITAEEVAEIRAKYKDYAGPPTREQLELVPDQADELLNAGK